MVTVSSINHQSINLLWEIRRKSSEQHKGQLKLSNPKLIENIEEIYEESTDMRLCELIEQFFFDIDHPMVSELSNEKAAKEKPERFMIYRGQRVPKPNS